MGEKNQAVRRPHAFQRRYRTFRLDCRVCGEMGEIAAFFDDEDDGVRFAAPFWFVRDDGPFELDLAKTAENAVRGLPERPPEIERATCPCGKDDVVIRLHESTLTSMTPAWEPLDPCDLPA